MLLQVILFEIDCAISYKNLHELFCKFISWTNWVNSGKLMDNCWISCQVMADMKKVYDNLMIIYLPFKSDTDGIPTLWFVALLIAEFVKEKTMNGYIISKEQKN